MTSGDPRDWMWAEACAMLERAERLRRRFFEPHFADAHAVKWEPPVDIFEGEREVWIIAALPGVDSQDLEIYIEANALVLSGRRPLPRAARAAIIHRLEIPHGRFERRLRLASTRLQLSRQELVSGCLILTLTKEL